MRGQTGTKEANELRQYPTRSDQARGMLGYQRVLLAACIVLAPLSLALYVLAWPENPANVVVNNTQAFMVRTAQMAGPAAHTLHMIGGVAASFFLPIGFLGMSLLGMRRAPGLATVCAALSLAGWIPWAGLMGIDDLAILIARSGPTPELNAIWRALNSGGVMAAYLIIYVIGHLLAAVLLGVMLGRLRLVPAWAAWTLALSSPFTMALFAIKAVAAGYVLRTVVLALLLAGSIPAAVAMLQRKDLEESAPAPAS